MRKFIITGTGRCGTKWCATTLRIGGILCGHEQIIVTDQLPKLEQQSWGNYEGESSLAAVPFLHRYQDVRSLLVVRHPLDCCTSFIRAGSFKEETHPPGLMTYLKEHHPEVMRAPDNKVATIRYWIAWNRMALGQTDEVARIEDLTVLTVADLFGYVGREPRWPMYPLHRANQGPQNGPSVSWDDFPDQELSEAKELCAQFGYEIE